MIQYSEATLDAMPLTKLSTKVEQTKVDVEGTMTEFCNGLFLQTMLMNISAQMLHEGCRSLH